MQNNCGVLCIALEILGKEFRHGAGNCFTWRKVVGVLLEVDVLSSKCDLRLKTDPV